MKLLGEDSFPKKQTFFFLLETWRNINSKAKKLKLSNLLQQMSNTLKLVTSLFEVGFIKRGLWEEPISRSRRFKQLPKKKKRCFWNPIESISPHLELVIPCRKINRFERDKNLATSNRLTTVRKFQGTCVLLQHLPSAFKRDYTLRATLILFKW